MPSTPPPPPVAIGELVAGKYRVERVIGHGGMGVVVAAMHEQLAQRVAIKMLLPEAKTSANALARFTREARAAAAIRGEHVARVLDVGELESGAPYIVMEYLEGRDLAETIVARGTLPTEEAVAFVLQACEAIAEAHAAGIVHRDLKPSNLFVTTRPDGTAIVKVLDFGISKALLSSGGEGTLTTTSSFVGSPVYSPPEQLVRAHDVDGRADIWSLGTILFEALSGRPPFVGDSVMHVASRIFNESPTPLSELRPDLPLELCGAVMRCLRKAPSDRFSDVGELAAALAPFAPSHSVSAERIARIVGSSLPSSRIAAVGYADTVHDSSKLASGETPHALVSAHTPSTTGSRRWVFIAVGAALAGAALIAIVAVGRGPVASSSPPPPVTSPGPDLIAPTPVPSQEPVVLVAPASSVAASASATSPSASAASPAHPPPQVPPKKNPLSVGVK
ncbi:MAG TPA: serine/threonine-protein kinase [Polyangiaceae bacterium]|jgi:serine/threonine-protein kinase